MAQVIRRDDLAIKAYGQAGFRSAEKTAYWSTRLHHAGVPTPPATLDQRANEVSFPWIDGRPLRQMFADKDCAIHVSQLVGKRWICELALRALIKLHHATARRDALGEFHPWQKTDERILRGIKSGDPAFIKAANRVAEWKRELDEQVSDHSGPPLSIVHGDLHVGQMICEQTTRSVWLLDLDDIAIGPSEADLGNFVAHFVTDQTLFGGQPAEGFWPLAAMLIEIYDELSDTPIEPEKVSTFGAVALLRRALKLAENGMPESSVSGIFDAVERLAM